MLRSVSVNSAGNPGKEEEGCGVILHNKGQHLSENTRFSCFCCFAAYSVGSRARRSFNSTDALHCGANAK